MSAEWDIIDALVQNLRTIDGLHPEYGPDPKIITPAVIPMLSFEHDTSWGDLEGPLSGSLYLLFKYGAIGRDGWKLMYDYRSPVGDKSITATLMATHSETGALPTEATPEGVVAGIRVVKATSPKAYHFGDGVLFWGCELTLQIWPKE